MATTKKATTPKAEAEPTPEAPAEATGHDGWGHDWRNPDARFAPDDRCANAEMRRLADR